jgi:hypothetical protein
MMVARRILGLRTTRRSEETVGSLKTLIVGRFGARPVEVVSQVFLRPPTPSFSQVVGEKACRLRGVFLLLLMYVTRARGCPCGVLQSRQVLD